MYTRTRTFWVSRKRSLATPLMNPSVIFQLSRGYQAKKLLSVRVTWQENPSCPESLLSPECRAITPSALSAVKFRCVCVIVFFFPWIVPLLCTVGYALQQAAIIHTKELFFFSIPLESVDLWTQRALARSTSRGRHNYIELSEWLIYQNDEIVEPIRFASRNMGQKVTPDAFIPASCQGNNKR